MERPLCKCHGEPMSKNGHELPKNGGRQKWACRHERIAHWHRYYASMSGVAYNRMIARGRRHHALKRMAARAAGR